MLSLQTIAAARGPVSPDGKIVAIMRVCIVAFIVLLVVYLPAAAQTAVPADKAVTTIEDIEIGMSADPVISGLTKKGYTLVDAFKTGDPAQWNVSLQDKYLGAFTVEKGRVTGVEVPVYTGYDNGGIDLGEALYWILYDNGKTLPSKDRDWKQTSTDAHLTTREIETRTGSSWRMIFVDTANGASYRISLFRSADGKPSVLVTKLAPFAKTK